ncbi:MAG TPA: hypothetical protein VJH87_15305 [Vicinamibacteria bacterium]|nr:hypothetical protein [Vicinamibacteria bacterium]
MMSPSRSAHEANGLLVQHLPMDQHKLIWRFSTLAYAAIANSARTSLSRGPRSGAVRHRPDKLVPKSAPSIRSRTPGNRPAVVRPAHASWHGTQ